ncbi:TraY domain-containing protein [Serratia sp. JSRIV006]|uniref:TraY domain-containing protein n=1 Tax=Serratia sp. JSRIV006 TaxID=2831896 RepID=UPI001CBE97DF|nr:TraY domain-containing protein [Serratia sp. JSRIV006]UAN65790.1 TraY domain-containing protein [Serratia sp. JSRIV006]
MIKRQSSRGSIVTMSIYLDPETDLKLRKAKDRSGRSKSAEVLIRLRDHLGKHPDFYNAELAEVMNNKTEPKS